VTREFSIAEAKDHLSEVVRPAEENGIVELTRRGRSAAVVVSAREFRRLCSSSSKPFAFLEELCNSHDADHHGLEPGDLDWVRDKHPGRAVRL
jgi:prevent-host-death family protein